MKNTGNEIAIIGISCEFPKAVTLNEYWSNLCDGVECLTEFSEEELLAAGVPQRDLKKPNYVRIGGVLSDIEGFDAGFFGYNPREAQLMDPQQRRMLEHVWWALEDAGYDPIQSDKIIGFYAGASLNTYLINNLLSYPEIMQSDYAQQLLFGNSHDYLATRAAHFFNFRGPAITLQTACSTSLIIVHQACQSLLTYQADTMIAGAVTIRVPQKQGYLHTTEGFLSRDGHCKAFDQDASGTIFTNGVGVIVLKRLQDALDDCDNIYAVIKAIAVNNDGSDKVSYAAPNADGQAEVIALAQTLADVDSDTISYVEAHGTATNIGDPIEICALTKAFQMKSSKKQFCAIGSVKGNIGHLDVAAGMAGLIKVVLALKNKKIPPSLHYQSANSKLSLHKTPFYVNDKLSEWKGNDGQPLRAAVSSFGIGGTNGHAILEEFAVKSDNDTAGYGANVFVFSAKTRSALFCLIKSFINYLQNNDRVSLHDIAYTLQMGRHIFPYRRAIVADSYAKLLEEIQEPFEPILCEEQLEQYIITEPLSKISPASLKIVAQKWLHGNVVCWGDLYSGTLVKRVHLPVYPFQREKHWIEPYKLDVRVEKKNLDVDEWFYVPTWKQALLPRVNLTSSSGWSLVFANRDEFSQALIAKLSNTTNSVVVFIGHSWEQEKKHVFSINPACYEHYLKLIDSLVKEKINVGNIIHLWSLTEDTSSEITDESFEQSQLLGLYSLLRLMHAIDKGMQKLPLRISVVGNKIYNMSGNERSNPNKATLVALPKVIPKEYDYVSMQVIDIEFVTATPSLAVIDHLVTEVNKSSYDDSEIIYRGTMRWVRDYTQVVTNPVSANRPHYLKENSVVIITGGLGQMGLDICDYFSRFPDLTLVLLTRSAFIDESKWESWLVKHDDENQISVKIKRLKTLKQAGLKILIRQVDISMGDVLSTNLDQIVAEQGHIDVVIHAAGDTGNGIIAVQNPENIANYFSAFSAKVYGSYNLAKALAKHSISFMVLCSSMNAIIGGLGQVENTVVNVFVDHFAEFLSQHANYRVLAINWGAVNLSRPPKINVLPQFLNLSVEHKKNYMDDKETYEVYNRIMNYDFGPRLLISTVDIDDVLHNWNRVASINELGKEKSSVTQAAQHVDIKTKFPTEMENFVASYWSSLLGVEDISLEDDFFVLGGHSLAAVQVINKISEKYFLKLHVMTLFELPRLGLFCEYLNKMLQEKVAKKEMESVL